MKTIKILILVLIINIVSCKGIYSQGSLILEINLNRKTPLIQNTYLVKSSKKRACDLNKRQEWSHKGFEKYFYNGYLTFKPKIIGENLARNFKSDQDIINAWMNSPTHKDNIVNPKFKYIGIGRCGNYVVAHFGE